MDQKKGYLNQSAGEYQTAILYDRDNFGYQLGLAQTYAALGRMNEAVAYLVPLHERQPESGIVNLELARISAKNGESATAIRYYHNALYALWPPDSESQRLAGRFELIEFLLKQNDKVHAQAELIALGENLPSDSGLQVRTADLFSQAQDYEHALALYLEALKTNSHDRAALKGAGESAFALRRYDLAHRYTQLAVSGSSPDPASAELLRTTELIRKMDPFVRGISVSQRRQIVLDAFVTAGERLQSCWATSQPALDTRWKELKPQVNESMLKRDPDLVDIAMNLVFDIEQATSVQCGAPTGKDHALLLISKLHDGGER
jgi:tetratricopeptide (TPR) repeat protein